MLQPLSITTQWANIYTVSKFTLHSQDEKFSNTWCVNVNILLHLVRPRCIFAHVNCTIDDNSFWKIHCFTFFPYKSIRDQILPCHKTGQGQPRVIIWANLVVLEHPRMHTKIQGHWPFGGKEGFFRFLPYMGMAAILVMWPGAFEQTLFPPSHRSSIWYLTLTGPVVSEEKMFIERGRRRRQRRPTYPTSSPNEPLDQVS